MNEMWALKLIEVGGTTRLLSGILNVVYWEKQDVDGIEKIGILYHKVNNQSRLLHPSNDLKDEFFIAASDILEAYLLNADGKTVEVIKKPS